MKMTTLFLFLFLSLASAVGSRVFLFPEESNSTYVQVTPLKPMNLNAFTICMRVATELQREMILFAYRTQNCNGLNLWHQNGMYSMVLGGSTFTIKLIPLSAFPTHLCVTWDFSTGITTFWINGQRSMLKIYKPGHGVKPNGKIILGQDPDTFVGGFESSQCFVGEISDLYLWDSVLSADHIKQAYENVCGVSGNVLNWNSLEYQIFGNVSEVFPTSA